MIMKEKQKMQHTKQVKLFRLSLKVVIKSLDPPPIHPPHRTLDGSIDKEKEDINNFKKYMKTQQGINKEINT